jgi:protein-S-isoprenylcysteine O-methyltransferase Ste14
MQVTLRKLVDPTIDDPTDVPLPAAHPPASAATRIWRGLALLYGVAAYAVFLVTILYAVGFVSGVLVPKTIDSGAAGAVIWAIVVDLLLLGLFAVQHSVMARRSFKQWWTRFVPKPIERSTYVLLASLALGLLMWQWRPVPAVVWAVTDPTLAAAVTALSFAGWLMVFFSTFLINHFELFGLHQVASHLVGRPMPPHRFRTPLLYAFVRHPIYLGFLVAFWAAPVMTVGRLVFAAATTVSIFIGIMLEERDLLHQFGEDYRRYRTRVAMLVPWRRAA